MYITDSIAILGSGLTAIANLPILIIGRFLCGFAVGLNSSLVPLYINEVSPIQLNGITGSMNQILICLGLLTSYLLGYGIPYTNKDDPSVTANTQYSELFWRLFMVLPGLVSLMRTLLLIFVLPYETPKYLVLQGHDESAVKVLEKIYKGSAVQEQFDQLQEEKKLQDQSGKLTYKELSSKTYKRRLFVGCGLSLLQQLSGINAFSMFSNKIFLGADTKLTEDTYNQARNFTTILGIVNLIVPILCSLISNKVGRRSLLLWGNALCLVCLTIFPLSDTTLPNLSKIAVFGYAVGYGFSLGPIVWMVIPEILPDLGIGVAVLANWSTAFLVVQAFPLLPFGTYNFLIFAACCAIGEVFVYIYVEETMGKTPKEIAAIYSSGGKYREDILKSSAPKLTENDYSDIKPNISHIQMVFSANTSILSPVAADASKNLSPLDPRKLARSKFVRANEDVSPLGVTSPTDGVEKEVSPTNFEFRVLPGDEEGESWPNEEEEERVEVTFHAVKEQNQLEEIVSPVKGFATPKIGYTPEGKKDLKERVGITPETGDKSPNELESGEKKTEEELSKTREKGLRLDFSNASDEEV